MLYKKEAGGPHRSTHQQLVHLFQNFKYETHLNHCKTRTVLIYLYIKQYIKMSQKPTFCLPYPKIKDASTDKS